MRAYDTFRDHRMKDLAERLRECKMLVKLVALGEAQAAVDLCRRVDQAADALDAQGKAGARRHNETGNAPDDEYLDPHGECAAEIQSLRQQVAALREALRKHAIEYRDLTTLLCKECGHEWRDGDLCERHAPDCLAQLAPSERAEG